MQLRDLTRVTDLLSPSPAPYHIESVPTRRRRRVSVAITLALGTALLALALATGPEDKRFYGLTFALAFAWLVGAWLSGPLHLGHWFDRRDLVRPTLLALLSFALFVVGDLVFMQVPVLARQVTELISRADTGAKSLVLAVALVNAVGEELFFRGALYSAFGRNHPALWSTAAYIASTAFTGNVALVVAGAVMGTLFALERRATRGILAPLVTHLVWSVLMITLLPR